MMMVECYLRDMGRGGWWWHVSRSMWYWVVQMLLLLLDGLMPCGSGSSSRMDVGLENHLRVGGVMMMRMMMMMLMLVR